MFTTQNLSLDLIKQSLQNQQSMLLYQHHQPQFRNFVKQFKSSKNLQSNDLEYVIELFCNVIDHSESYEGLHQIIVMVNIIFNLKNQLVVKILSRRKTISKIVNYFQYIIEQLELEVQQRRCTQNKKFQVYAVLHFLTILLNYESKQMNLSKDKTNGLFNNKVLINQFFSINTQIIKEKQSIYLISISMFLLVKNLDLSVYLNKIKVFILESITSVKEVKARKNFIECFRRIWLMSKIQEKEINRNCIMEWIVNNFDNKNIQDKRDLVELVKLILIKMPNLSRKLIELRFVGILQQFFFTRTETVCTIYNIMIPYMNQQVKQHVYKFLINHLNYSPQNTLKSIGQLISDLSLFYLINHIQTDTILYQIKHLVDHNESSMVLYLSLTYIQNLIKTITKYNEQLGISLMQKIYFSKVLHNLQNHTNLKLKEKYQNFKKLYKLE